MNVTELIEKLKEFDPNAVVLIKDHYKGWVRPKPDNIKMMPSPLQDGEPEERDKLLFIRPS